MDALSKIIHEVGQIFLVPCIAVLLIFVMITLMQIGSLLIEYFMERRHMRADVPILLDRMHGADAKSLHDLIADGGLLNRQKAVLLTILETKLPELERLALARSLLTSEEKYYEKANLVTDLISKLGPMFGLLGTLIPLGPGVMALGEGNTLVLSQSLAIAFDTTIIGLLTAAFCYTISRIRAGWYDLYLQTTETLMECLLEELKAGLKGSDS